MSSRQRGTEQESEILDTLLGNKKRTISTALAAAAVGYLLFLIFGDPHATDDALYRPIVMGVLAFVALGLVLGVQLLNPRCSAKTMDRAELFFALASAAGFPLWMLFYGIGMLFGSEAYAAATIIAEVAGAWCALCLIHNLRK